MSDIDISQYPRTVEAFGGREQGAVVFLDRYSKKDNLTGSPVELVPDLMWLRVAEEMSGYKHVPGTVMSGRLLRFYNLLKDFKFVPGGRINSGAGTGTEVTYYNCYVIPVETRGRRANRVNMVKWDYRPDDFPSERLEDDKGNDSREAIIDTVGVMVDIMSRGGGVGVNWSTLRPRNSHLKRINATSSGPIDWMHFASTAVGTVEQGGSRRGAAMFMLNDWHPDVLEFIDAKRDLTRITNANISVGVSDDLMEAVRFDLDWEFVFPDTSDPDYDSEWDGDLDKWLQGDHAVKSHGTIRARDLWRKLAQAAWDNGEPGIVFLDRYNEMSTAKDAEKIIAVNPCGEQGLGAYSVCNLGSMNLTKYVETIGTDFEPVFVWERFGRDVETAVEFMDEVIDKNFYFLPENEDIQKKLRRIGLGVMGLADALVMLGIRYGSPEAVLFTESVFRWMKDKAIEASMRLAAEKGPAPAWDDLMWDRPYLYEYHQRHDQGWPAKPLRNIFLLTQAPTGTTSILAGVNSGIEPFFDLEYTRTDRTGTHTVQVQPVVDFLDSRGVHGGGPLGELRQTLPGYFVTAADVTVEEHIAMQAAAQKYIDSSVSKTINAPNSHTVEDVEKAFTLAYEKGLKGLAYFRDGCGRAQVLTREEPKEKVMSLAQAFDEVVEERNHYKQLWEAESKSDPDYSRPDALSGKTHKVRAGSQTTYVTVNRDHGRPVEVFVSVGKSGTEMMAMGEAIGRLASIALQKGANLSDLVDQLDGVGNNGFINRSLPSAIAAALKEDHVAFEANVPANFEEAFAEIRKEISQGVITKDEAWKRETAQGDICPECGQYGLVRQEGCMKCIACSYSAC